MNFHPRENILLTSGLDRKAIEGSLRSTGIYNRPRAISNYLDIPEKEWLAQRDKKDTSEIEPDHIVPDEIKYQIDYLLRLPEHILDKLILIEQQDQNRP